MTHQNTAVRDDLENLAKDAESLVMDSCDSVSEQLGKASSGLDSLRKRGDQLYRHARDQGIAGGKIIHHELQDHSFRYVGIAAGVGALLGCLVASRFSSRPCTCK